MTELKIESKFYELQLMSTVIKELLELVEIPKELDREIEINKNAVFNI